MTSVAARSSWDTYGEVSMMRNRGVIAIVVCSLLILGLEGYLTPAHATKTFSVSGVAGACRLQNGVLTIQNSGRVSWKGDVASNHSGNDAYCLTFTFHDANGTKVFEWPRICSPTLYPVYQTWSRNNLAVPQYLYDTIKSVQWVNHC